MTAASRASAPTFERLNSPSQKPRFLLYEMIVSNQRCSEACERSEHHWFETIISYSKKRGFWLGLLNRSNVGALAREAAVTVPAYLAARLVGGRVREE